MDDIKWLLAAVIVTALILGATAYYGQNQRQPVRAAPTILSSAEACRGPWSTAEEAEPCCMVPVLRAGDPVTPGGYYCDAPGQETRRAHPI